MTADPKEVGDEAVKLAKGGMAAEIGAILRDGMGVPSIRTVSGKRMTQVLAEGGVKPDLPDDLQALLKRVVHLQRHLAAPPEGPVESAGSLAHGIPDPWLALYYRAQKRLPENWRYTSASAVLQVE